MPFIEFTGEPRKSSGGKGIFEVGKVYEMNEASCARWIKRNVAVASKGPASKGAKAAVAAANDAALVETATAPAPEENAAEPAAETR